MSLDENPNPPDGALPALLADLELVAQAAFGRQERDAAQTERDRALAEVRALSILLAKATVETNDLRVEIAAYEALLTGALEPEVNEKGKQ